MFQMTIDKLYPMPCPFKIGDIVYDKQFDKGGTVIRVYGEFCEYQLTGTKGAKGLRYGTGKELIRIGRIEDQNEILRMETEAKIFFERIRRYNRHDKEL